MQDFEAFIFAMLFDLFAEHNLGAGVVAAFVELEASAPVRLVDRPAGEHASHFGDVVLGVAAVYAQCVEFHELAPIVFVEAVALGFGRTLRRREPCRRRKTTAPSAAAKAAVFRLPAYSACFVGSGPHAEPVIEIEEHGRALRRGHQQIFKFSQCVGTNDVTLVAGDQEPVGAFADKDVEVVEPEIGHHLFELPLAVGSAQQLALR